MMTSPCNILHTCETAMGGVGVYQKYLAGMNMEEVAQIFLMPQEHVGIMEGDKRVRPYPRGKRGLGGIFRQIGALRKAIKDNEPDVVVFHSTFSLMALALTRLRLSRMKRPRLIYVAHGWAGEQYSGMKARLVRAVEGNLCGCADLVINVSHNDLETARRYGYRGRHAVIENAVPDALTMAEGDRFATQPEAMHLLFVGRFDHQKGLDILLEALTRAQEQRPELKLHLIGGAVRESSVLALPPQIDLIGWVPRDEVDGWYRSADALVVSSRWEGLPLVIPEALRNGTPVVVSQRSGMEHLFDEGQEGFSYTLTVDALAARLATLDRTELRMMRPACRKLYERRYSMPRLYAEILRAYLGEIEVAWKRGDMVQLRTYECDIECRKA